MLTFPGSLKMFGSLDQADLRKSFRSAFGDARTNGRGQVGGVNLELRTIPNMPIL